MKRLELAKLIRLRTKTDTITFPDSEMLLYANVFIYEFAKQVNAVDEDYFGSISTTDLILNQREYRLPTDTLNEITAVEVNFTGNDSDWTRLAELNLNRERGSNSEFNILNRSSNLSGGCGYDIYRNSLFIYSGEIKNVTGGIKLYSFSEPDSIADLTDNISDISLDLTSTGHGLPKTFHELLARRISMEYKNNAQQPMPYSELEQKFEYDFSIALNSLRGRNKDRVVMARVPGMDGYGGGYSDLGYNY